MTSCETCIYMLHLGEGLDANGKKSRRLFCRFFPPTGTLLPMQIRPTPTNPQGMHFEPISFFPPCPPAPQNWCGKYSEKKDAN